MKISQALAPFSHGCGMTLLIPGTFYEAEIFPTLIRFYDVRGVSREKCKEVFLEVEGPVEQFTVMQDLERGCITVWGRTLHYHILPTLEIVAGKKPGLPLKPFEKLFLGSHKKQQWEKIAERADFTEIFPLWHRLGSLLTMQLPRSVAEGIYLLLLECEQAIKGPPEHILKAFKRLFLAGFRSFLTPTLFDDRYQGIVKGEAKSGTPLILLKKGAALIRSLFIECGEDGIHILPHLPPEFHAGRFLNIATPFGQLDMEWSKKTIRSIAFRSTYEGKLPFYFRSNLKEYRLRHTVKERGTFQSCKEPLEIKSGSLYLLDRFKK